MRTYINPTTKLYSFLIGKKLLTNLKTGFNVTSSVYVKLKIDTELCDITHLANTKWWRHKNRRMLKRLRGYN